MSLLRSITAVQPSSSTQSKLHPLSPHQIPTVKPLLSFTQTLNLIKPLKLHQTRPKPITAVAAPGASGGEKEQKWTLQGVVTEALPSSVFRVKTANGDEILGTVSGKIRLNHIQILVGDKVKIEVSRYDSTRGRITFRLDENKKDKKKYNRGKK